MAWFLRHDRFGDSHLCFSQEAEQSCGLASTKMVVFKVNKLRPGQPAVTTEARVEAIYKKYDPTAVNVGQEGVYFSMLADVLNELGVGHWKHAQPAAEKIPEFLLAQLAPDVVGMGPVNTVLRGYPVLLKVNWGGPSHVVVLDTINKLPLVDAWWASICDPGDGDVHITRMHKGRPIAYEGSQVTWSINFWGKPAHNYAAGKTINGTITEVVYCDKPANFFG